MGEPLANINHLMPALETATDPKGLGISHRRITISTVGLPPAIDRLSAANVHYHLAVSLHAPNDELRNQLVPVNAKIGIDEVLDAADRYFEASGRRLTFEYVLLGGLNDKPEHARQLAALLQGRPALLNVIPYNPVSGLPYRTPGEHEQRKFLDILRHAGVNVQVRQRKGDRIDAACGRKAPDEISVSTYASAAPQVGQSKRGGGSVGSVTSHYSSTVRSRHGQLPSFDFISWVYFVMTTSPRTCVHSDTMLPTTPPALLPGFIRA